MYLNPITAPDLSEFLNELRNCLEPFEGHNADLEINIQSNAEGFSASINVVRIEGQRQTSLHERLANALTDQ